MIIACPACNTRYVVPDSAIGIDGRTVRCAKCKHSWFQEGPEIARPAGMPQEPGPQEPEPREPVPEPAGPAPGLVREGREEPLPEGPAGPDFASQGHDTDDPVPDFDRSPAPSPDRSDPQPVRDDPSFEETSRFDYAPPFRPRRNRVRLWTWAAAIFALLALGTIAAVSYLGVPDWVPIQRPLFALAEPDLRLDFPVEDQERRTLPNGTEFFGARVNVTNVARESRKVPPILIVLRDARERIVYSWEVVPTQNTLAPGETMTINEAITDVPKAAVFADIGWAPR